MTIEALPDLARRQFRAGSAYELVVFDRLQPEEQALLADLHTDGDFYGVLRPRAGTGRTVRVVDKSTALLWLTLQSPGPLPFFVWSGDPVAATKAVLELVLDGVLEIEEGGQFVSGAAAELTDGKRHVASEGRLACLSCEALRYGQSLGFDDPQRLALRLYAFGRQPVTAAWARRLGNAEAVLEFLGGGSKSSLGRRLASGWKRASGPQVSGWLAWAKADRRMVRAGSPVYKLYVSPVVDALPAVFPVAVETLSRRGCGRFKVGSNAAGLLRPDKLVLYFEDLESLMVVATELTKELTGVAPQGVPFSAEIAHDGLLSWGMDPPLSERVLAWQEPESWRLWIVRRLAVAMVAAQKNDGSRLPPWQFARERLRQSGVDVDGWMPSPAVWLTA